ncbi:TPA: hypothetical protein NJ353_003284 [Vibrio parahaemolyticus]|uniref:Sulfotransferase family protein n=1 Tax=Vibrio parahaemolyticus TaxID=670 RepID=A0A7M1VRH7_VIBPH|nr:hypothetical protein VP46_00041 [Vibrio parahaemolyticus]QOS24419.1 hypothetical protein VP47_00041 [Vibrio parahaemolyticus]HCE1501075.1 hypothetical protein [Vibrio parahaemolyticus]HCG7082831.1 hypothetical protein [Vibrio parahaemolyticus]HCH0724220.1 hypothetical protein [Vibrio parahaemolyticus]
MSSFSSFKYQLDSALELLESSDQIKQLDLPQVLGSQVVDTESLLSRCTNICDKHKKKKPTIRIIHHLACSGGTLISKCISSMPNVYLLSEVHPYTELGIDLNNPTYRPTDLISLAKYARFPKQRQLSAEMFLDGIQKLHSHTVETGGVLVLRDHTHADFCTKESIPAESALVSLLKEDFDVKSILTLRDPIDAFSSLRKNRWVHFAPNTFDEYCRRVLLVMDKFESKNTFRYESFVKAPEEIMNLMCVELSIPYDSVFKDIFGMFKVTGDSGRSSDIIHTRERMDISGLTKEIESSNYYKKYLSKINKLKV